MPEEKKERRKREDASGIYQENIRTLNARRLYGRWVLMVRMGVRLDINREPDLLR